MSSLSLDPERSDLLWMAFDGQSWDDFNALLSDLMNLTKDLPEPYCLIFDPAHDMPKGNPLPHIRRMMRYMENEPKFEHMIAIVPGWMKIAATFARLVLQLFPGKTLDGNGIVVDSREAALGAYSAYHAQKVA